MSTVPTTPATTARRMNRLSHFRVRRYVFAVVGLPKAEGEGGLSGSNCPAHLLNTTLPLLFPALEPSAVILRSRGTFCRALPPTFVANERSAPIADGDLRVLLAQRQHIGDRLRSIARLGRGAEQRSDEDAGGSQRMCSKASLQGHTTQLQRVYGLFKNPVEVQVMTSRLPLSVLSPRG